MRIACLIFVTSILVSCHSGSVGEKSWGLEQAIGISGQSIGTPRLSMDGQGNLSVAWFRNSESTAYVDVNRYAAAAGWGTAINVDQRNSVNGRNPEVAASEDGNVVILLGQTNGIEDDALISYQYIPGVGWSGARTVETTGLRHRYSVTGFDSFGVAHAVWVQIDDIASTPRVVNHYSSRFTQESGWSSSELIENSMGASVDSQPHVAVHSNGNAIAVWHQLTADSEWNIYSSRYIPTEGWGPSQQISSRPESAYNPQVAIDSQGNAVVAWMQRDDSVQGVSVFVSEFVSDIGWMSAVPIGPANGVNIGSPHLAVGSDDGVAMMWTGPLRDKVSSYRPPGQSWTNPVVVDSLDDLTLGQDIASRPDGGFIAVWSQYDGTSSMVFASQFSPNAGWTEPRAVNSSNEFDQARGAQIAVDNNGDAVVVWVQGKAGDANVYASRYE